MNSTRMFVFLFSLVLVSCLDEKKSKESDLPVIGSFTKLASMSVARASHVSDSINGKIYVIGGVSTSGYTNTVEEYDPNLDSWSFKSPMSSGRQGMGSAAYNNKIYVFGGYGVSATDLATVEEFDPNANTWTAKQNLPLATEYVSAATVGSKIYVFPRARSGYGLSASVWSYDPVNDIWDTSLASDSSDSYNGSNLAVVGTDIYFVGRDPILIYHTSSDSWSSIDGALGMTGNGGKNTFVSNDLIFMFDQISSPGQYTWSSGMSVYALNMGAAGYSFSSPFMVTLGATAINNNSAYISGGADYDDSISSDFYRFDYSP